MIPGALTIGLFGGAAAMLFAAALWRVRRAEDAPSRRFWRQAAAACFCFAVICGIAVGRISTSGKETLASAVLFEQTNYSAEELRAALATNAPVFAQFNADWCATCKVNDRVAINTEETAALFREQGVKVLIGDWTEEDPEITAILSAYGHAGVPMYLFFPPGAEPDEGILLPQILTTSILREAMTSAEGG